MSMTVWRTLMLKSWNTFQMVRTSLRIAWTDVIGRDRLPTDVCTHLTSLILFLDRYKHYKILCLSDQALGNKVWIGRTPKVENSGFWAFKLLQGTPNTTDSDETLGPPLLFINQTIGTYRGAQSTHSSELWGNILGSNRGWPTQSSINTGDPTLGPQQGAPVTPKLTLDVKTWYNTQHNTIHNT